MREPTLPRCGQVDRAHQLTSVEVNTTKGWPIQFLVCTVPTCREFGRAFIEVRDPPIEEADA